MSNSFTVEPGIKDKDHPYTIVSRALIEDTSISINLRFLIIYCLSKPKEWVFHSHVIAKALCVHESTIQRYINEGIEAGYITRELNRDNGKFSGNRYMVFENKLPKQQKPSAVKPSAVFASHSINIRKKYEGTKNNERKDEVNQEELARYRRALDEALDVHKPKRRKNREIPRMLKIDGLPEKDQQMIANMFSDSVICLAVEDTKSYHRRHSIKNGAAFIMSRCKHHHKKQNP